MKRIRPKKLYGQLITIPCETCGKEFQKSLIQLKKVKRHFCSRACFGKANENSVEDFWRRVNKASDGCWEWTGRRSVDGYGTLMVTRRQIRSHRFSYELVHGPIPAGLHVLHRCDNPPCVNPDHLFLGTNADNTEDKCIKDRAGLKLKTRDVHAIIDACKAGRTQRSVAKEFGVSSSHVSKLCSGLGRIADAYVNEK